MSKFKPGDRVRCVDGHPKYGLHADGVYVVTKWKPSIIDMVALEGLEESFFAHRFILAEPENTYPAQQEPDYLAQRVKEWQHVIDGWVPFSKRQQLPATAKAILDLDRKPQITPAQQQQAEGVARAVQSMTRNSAIIGSYRRSDF